MCYFFRFTSAILLLRNLDLLVRHALVVQHSVLTILQMWQPEVTSRLSKLKRGVFAYCIPYDSCYYMETAM